MRISETVNISWILLVPIYALYLAHTYTKHTQTIVYIHSQMHTHTHTQHTHTTHTHTQRTCTHMYTQHWNMNKSVNSGKLGICMRYQNSDGSCQVAAVSPIWCLELTQNVIPRFSQNKRPFSLQLLWQNLARCQSLDVSFTKMWKHRGGVPCFVY